MTILGFHPYLHGRERSEEMHAPLSPKGETAIHSLKTTVDVFMLYNEAGNIDIGWIRRQAS